MVHLRLSSSAQFDSAGTKFTTSPAGRAGCTMASKMPVSTDTMRYHASKTRASAHGRRTLLIHIARYRAHFTCRYAAHCPSMPITPNGEAPRKSCTAPTVGIWTHARGCTCRTSTEVRCQFEDARRAVITAP